MNPPPYDAAIDPYAVAQALRVDRDGPVVTLTLRRPGTARVRADDLLTALHRCGSDLTGEIRIVVVRGDWEAYRELPDPALTVAGDEAMSWLRAADLVSVAAVTGALSGTATHLALACDLRVLSAASSVVCSDVRSGVLSGLGGIGRMAALVGPGRAFEICTTGRSVFAHEAEAIGLATATAPEGMVESAVARLVDGILSSPRDAVTETKALLTGCDGGRAAAMAAAERAARVRGLGERPDGTPGCRVRRGAGKLGDAPRDAQGERVRRS